jgi:hypothetical protein
MCNATDGANPVSACTCAASATFSSTDRGAPADPNTLNRVPEFPNAHDGNSIACRASWSVMSSKIMSEAVLWSVGEPQTELEAAASRSEYADDNIELDRFTRAASIALTTLVLEESKRFTPPGNPANAGP